jgi:hypothetical protein
MATATVPSPDADANGAGQCGGRGVQKRFDRLTKEKYELREENGQLRGDLKRALDLIERYKQALRRARRVNAE